MTGGKFANGAAGSAFGMVVSSVGTTKPTREMAALCHSLEECNGYFEADGPTKNTLEEYYDVDEIGRANAKLNGYLGQSPTGLYARALTTSGGTRRVIDKDTGQLITEYKVTDYEVSRSPRFRKSTIVRNVGSPKNFVIDPRGKGGSLAVYGQVDIKTNYGIRAEFRTIRLDKIDHQRLYQSYIKQR